MPDDDHWRRVQADKASVLIKVLLPIMVPSVALSIVTGLSVFGVLGGLLAISIGLWRIFRGDFDS